jgi:peptide/nickel transport system permease protein
MKYLLRKCGLYVFIAWAAVTLNFLVPRLMPGDPVGLLINKLNGNVDPGAIAALRKAFGLTNAPLINQYWDYLVNLFHGDLGLSISFYPVPVADVVAGALPWTLGLVGITTIISFLLGTGIGIWLAWRRGTWTDGIVPAMTFFSAIPYFWLALILVLVFGVTLGWLPLSGAYDTSTSPGMNLEFIGSVIQHAVLPAITIVLASFAGWLLGMRNMMMTTLGEEYVTMAEAKGLPKRTVMVRYAARNAILPSITSFALSLGAVVGGSILTEVIFNYPGVGYTLFLAVQSQDYPLMQGLFLIISLTVIVANLLADIVYIFLDPRTRAEG